MKRCIAILALALTATVNADQAFAQANQSPMLALSMVNTAEAGMDDITGMLQRTYTATDDFWLIIDIVEDPQAAYETLVDIGIPESLADDMVFEALSIFATIEHSGL